MEPGHPTLPVPDSSAVPGLLDATRDLTADLARRMQANARQAQELVTQLTRFTGQVTTLRRAHDELTGILRVRDDPEVRDTLDLISEALRHVTTMAGGAASSASSALQAAAELTEEATLVRLAVGSLRADLHDGPVPPPGGCP